MIIVMLFFSKIVRACGEEVFYFYPPAGGEQIKELPSASRRADFP